MKPPDPVFDGKSTKVIVEVRNVDRMPRIQPRAEAPLQAGKLTQIEDICGSGAIAHIRQESQAILKGLDLLGNLVLKFLDRDNGNLRLVSDHARA